MTCKWRRLWASVVAVAIVFSFVGVIPAAAANGGAAEAASGAAEAASEAAEAAEAALGDVIQFQNISSLIQQRAREGAGSRWPGLRAKSGR